jgi:hypothetical protein
MSPDNTPDFNSMSPEEIMAWLETLARKQGATEGFTTAANLDIPDIDPASVVIDEPGYVPYHEQSTTVQSVISPAAAPPAAPPPPRSLPVEPPPPVEASPAPVEADMMRTAPSPSMNAAASNSALAWLESLAADQGDALFNLDLTDDDAAPAPATDPVSWLEDLARAQGELGPLAPPSDVDQAPAAVEDEAQLDLNWLETIAARQGARPEELITAHNAVVPPQKLRNPRTHRFHLSDRSAPRQPLKLRRAIHPPGCDRWRLNRATMKLASGRPDRNLRLLRLLMLPMTCLKRRSTRRSRREPSPLSR